MWELVSSQIIWVVAHRSWELQQKVKKSARASAILWNISKENMNVLNYVLLNVTTGDRRRKAALSTELLQIPQGNALLEKPLLNSATKPLFFLIEKMTGRILFFLKITNVKEAQSC